MCGIIHCKKTNKNETVNKIVIRRFEKQRDRGVNGFGYIEIKNGVIIGEVRAQKEEEIMKKLRNSKADEIMFHHRTPTSTPNIVESPHPILVSHKDFKYDYYVVHNGIITNDYPMREKHLEEGFKYTTDIKKQLVTATNVYFTETIFNDSEAVAIDFCKMIEGKGEMEAEGSMALVALQFDKKTKRVISIFFGRNEKNPLCIEDDKKFLSISSETGRDLKVNTLYKYDYKTSKITETSKNIGKKETYSKDYYKYGYGGYLGSCGFKTENDDFDDEFISNGYKKYNNMDDEEEDFSFDLWQEILDLQEEIKNARLSGDEELAIDLEVELDTYKQELEDKGYDTQKYGFSPFI